MCRNAILPTAVYAESLDSEVMNLIYVFNRWLNMLESYGKLDCGKWHIGHLRMDEISIQEESSEIKEAS